MAYGGIPQGELISILFVDCGYRTARQQQGWLRAKFNVARTEDLTPQQKSEAVDLLKAERGNR